MWRYRNPVDIRFGVGSFDHLSDLIGGRRYGLVTYTEPFFDELSGKLDAKAGAPAVTINDVLPNPDYALLAAQTALICDDRRPDVWVALGGGSVIDSAKVFAATGGDFANVARYVETGDGAEELSDTPIIAVPTTAGTGSEVTCWATVWNEETGRKLSLARDNLYPETALIDPALMLGKPKALTISTGLDALSHALESLWNVNVNPVSADHAVAAARDVIEVLPKLACDLGNIEHRTRMAKAALSAGLAFSNTKTALAHSLSYPITLQHGVPHGLACSFSLPMIIRSLIGCGDLCEEALQRIFGEDLNSASGKLSLMLNELGVSTLPFDHGVAESKWSTLVDDAFDGERGRNFIGDKTTFLKALSSFGKSS